MKSPRSSSGRLIGLPQVVVAGTGTVSSLASISMASSYSGGYGLVAVYPAAFLVVYLTTFGRIPIAESRSPFLLAIYSLIQWLRFVVMPMAIGLSDGRAGVRVVAPSTSSIELASLLILVELIVGALVVGHLARRGDRPRPSALDATLRGNRLVYLFFIVLAAIVYWAFGRANDLLNFVVLPAGSGERVGDLTDTRLVLSRQVVLIALFVSFMWAVAVCGPKFRMSGKRRYIVVPVILAVINVSLIVGERRSAQVLTAFCATLILVRAFPGLRTRILVVVCGSAAAVLALMSIYKFLNVFEYGSYSQALESSDLDAAWLAQTLQAYFGGPQLVAAMVEFANLRSSGVDSFLYDLVRSTVPVSFLVKGDSLLISEMFNMHVYVGRQRTGQVVSSAGYGYFVFGAGFFWVFAVVNIVGAYIAERFIWSARSYEAMFLASYIFMRIALNVTANTPALVSGATVMLASAGILFAVAGLLTSKRREDAVRQKHGAGVLRSSRVRRQTSRPDRSPL